MKQVVDAKVESAYANCQRSILLTGPLVTGPMSWNAAWQAANASVRQSMGLSSYIYQSAGLFERWAGGHYSNNYLAQRIIGHYQDGSGATMRLSQQEAADLHVRPLSLLIAGYEDKLEGGVPKPIANREFLDRVNALSEQATREQRDVVTQALVKGGGYASVHATLGRFTVYYEGELRVQAGGAWHFKGTMQFYDSINFESRSDRTSGAESKVQQARSMLSGTPYSVITDKMDVEDSNVSPEAQWVGTGRSSAVPPTE